ncbi:MAG: hypothetical protein QM771_07135 [Nitrospira sp.]
MEMDGTKSAGMMRKEATPSRSILYQVCVDHPGEEPFDGTGVQFDDHAKALAHLKDTQRTKPQAYLAAVTYQRCDANGEFAILQPRSERPTPSTADNLESIESFAGHGLRAIHTLQALTRVLGYLQPSEEEEPGQIADDLVAVMKGLTPQLQTIYDAFDNIEIRAQTDSARTASSDHGHTAQHEPAMV